MGNPLCDPVFLEYDEQFGLEHTHTHDSDGSIIENPKAGEPAPVTSVGIKIPMPVQIEGGDLTMQSRAVTIAQEAQPVDPDASLLATRIIPGTRIIETCRPPVVEILRREGFNEISMPSKTSRTVIRTETRSTSPENTSSSSSTDTESSSSGTDSGSNSDDATKE